jgi:hypothetical protein
MTLKIMFGILIPVIVLAICISLWGYLYNNEETICPFAKEHNLHFSEGDSTNAEMKTIDQFKKKYGFVVSSLHLKGRVETIKNFGISFTHYEILNKQEARKLFLECADQFLYNINSDETIRSKLCCYPFPIEKIDFELYFQTPTKTVPLHPLFNTIGFSKGNIRYTTEEQKTMFFEGKGLHKYHLYKFHVDEPIERAREIVADPTLEKYYAWDKEIQVQGALESVLKTMDAKYGLWNNSSLTLKHKDKSIDLNIEMSFKGYADINMWRRVIIETVEGSLTKLNDNADIREFFQTPITNENFIIKFIAGGPSEEGCFDHAEIILKNGFITYKKSELVHYKLLEEIQEPYEEAVKIVKESPEWIGEKGRKPEY